MFFEPNSELDNPKESLDRLHYDEELHSTARDFLRGKKYKGFDITVDDWVNWEVLALLKEKWESGEKMSQLERVINDVAVFYMGGKDKVSVAEKEDVLTTEQFIDYLLEEIKKFEPDFRELSLTQLRIEVSKIIKDSSYFLKHVVARLKNSNDIKTYNPKYTFSEELLDLFGDRLEEKYGERAKTCLNIIEKYRASNELKVYSKQQYHYHNPNLDSRFFSRLDTEDKGYWFGFMLSDGSITLGNDDIVRYQIAIELSIKDKDQLVRFCQTVGIDPTKIGKRTREIDGTEYEVAYIEFTCKEMTQDLRALGYFEFKEGGKLPSFEGFTSDIQRAIVLGVFDGDGIQGTSKISTTNVQFLHQLKEYYDIKYEVRKKIDIDADYINNNPIRPTKNLYSLSLGATLFNSLLNNYRNSMNRKRIILDEYRDKYDNLKDLIGSKDHLQNMVNNFPRSWLARHFNCDVRTLNKLCTEWDIELQKNGFWTFDKLEEAREKFDKLFK